MRETKQFVLKRIEQLSVWQRDGVRAPHKPLLIILALSRVTRTCDRLTPFKELEKPLARLLRDYGPPRRSVHPEYPFWWLRTDQLWEVPESDSLARRIGHTDPRKSELIKNNVKGGFPEPVFELFRSDVRFVALVARKLLDAHFPASLHQDILDEVGLYLPPDSRRREPQFRQDVIRAYEHRCAICGYDLKIGSTDLALEAAHIRWRQASGPDEIRNGLALCAIHHKALDRGAIGISEDLRVLISAEIHGQSLMTEWFQSFNGGAVRRPTRADWEPRAEYIKWHTDQVFRKPARD
jgi:putative restriction endonuclease